MTTLLQDVFDDVSKLPADEQEAIARWLREELDSDRAWNERFEQSGDALSRLAAEALDEHRRGETEALDL